MRATVIHRAGHNTKTSPVIAVINVVTGSLYLRDEHNNFTTHRLGGSGEISVAPYDSLEDYLNHPYQEHVAVFDGDRVLLSFD
jgi:hypothetical protein